MRLRMLVLAVVGCGGNNNGSADAAHDTPPVPATINVAGVASERGLGGTTPVAGVVVGAYRNSDPNNAVAMATTDSNGNYGLVITTNGQPLDGYLKAAKSSYVDTYLYPPAPLYADFTMASLNMLTSGTLGTLYTLASTGQTAGLGTIALEVMDTQ